MDDKLFTIKEKVILLKGFLIRLLHELEKAPPSQPVLTAISSIRAELNNPTPKDEQELLQLVEKVHSKSPEERQKLKKKP